MKNTLNRNLSEATRNWPRQGSWRIFGENLAAGGSVLGAITASSCCILPLALFSLGASGAWLGALTALAPYQPVFIGFAVLCLGVGFVMVYRRPKERAGADGATCAWPAPRRVLKFVLWASAALTASAVGFNYYAPRLLAG